MSRRLPLLPALIFMVVLTQIPFLLTIWYSLQSWSLYHPDLKHFVWFHNYKLIVTDSIFRTAVINTVEFTVIPVVLSVLLGLTIAVLLDRHVPGRGFLRTLIISPFLVMPAAAALVWKFTILDTSFGVLNWFIGLFGFGHVDWTSSHSQGVIITVLTWQWTPFMVLILLSGLQSQGTDLLEAARVDGASAWRIFTALTLPHLRQYIELGVLLGSIYIVQAFDAIFMITAGGPGQKTTNLPYYLYEVAFRGFNIGRASAMGVVVVVATILIATLALRLISSLFSDEGMAGR
jgi:sorbitol/mannitol transport system permease protein